MGGGLVTPPQKPITKKDEFQPPPPTHPPIRRWAGGDDEDDAGDEVGEHEERLGRRVAREREVAEVRRTQGPQLATKQPVLSGGGGMTGSAAARGNESDRINCYVPNTTIPLPR